ncbi:hypothetical protein AOLI_G00229210 [Acnodon oligacanthus]
MALEHTGGPASDSSRDFLPPISLQRSLAPGLWLAEGQGGLSSHGLLLGYKQGELEFSFNILIKSRMAEKPGKKRLRTRDSSTDTEDLNTGGKVEVSVLQSINTKLLGLETQLSVIDVLHKDIREL